VTWQRLCTLFTLRYFPTTDTLYISLVSKPSLESEAATNDLIVDFSIDGEAVGITTNNYSKHTDTFEIETPDLPIIARYCQVSCPKRSLQCSSQHLSRMGLAKTPLGHLLKTQVAITFLWYSCRPIDVSNNVSPSF